MSVLFYLLVKTMIFNTSFAEHSKFTFNVNSVGNNMKFDKLYLRAKFGKKIIITFKNKADIKSEIQHNIAIVKKENLKKLYSILKSTSYDLSKITNNTSLIIKVSKTLNPGETDVISFRPDKVGQYIYVCLMPGHGPMMGMEGVLEITP